MKKITATITKEWLLLRRDVSGLLLLLVMPAVLIIVMALVQDAPFRDYQALRFDLLLADNDGGSLSREIRAGLKQSRNFHIIDTLDGKPITSIRLKQLLQEGKYRVGIVIPKGTTAEAVNTANIMANKLAQRLSIGRLPARERRDSMHIGLYFDPIAKPSFRTAISFALDKFITAASTNVLVERIGRLSGTGSDTSDNATEMRELFSGIGIREEVLGQRSKGKLAHLTSVQHNVPAWAIFGMFFIVVPLSGHMIGERVEGSALRLKLIPHAQAGVALGKILFNTLICFFQFIAMCCIGIWVLPQLGLSPLHLGQNPQALIPVILSTGFSATSYGYFIGTFFKTTNQALPFGAISIVILAAVGGILVPKDILPPVMQQIALISPLYWGLDGVNEIILRDGDIRNVLGHIGVLNLLGLVLWGSAMLHQHFNSRSI
jgi:ABC-2 type transport system permease protein